MSDILHMTVDQLKSELTVRDVVQLQGLTKPDLQEALCKTLSIEVIPSQLQELVTLATLDKASPNHSNHSSNANSNRSSNANSPVKSDATSCNETKFTSEQLFELEKLRIEMQMQMHKDELEMQVRIGKDELEIRIREKEIQAVSWKFEHVKEKFKQIMS